MLIELLNNNVSHLSRVYHFCSACCQYCLPWAAQLLRTGLLLQPGGPQGRLNAFPGCPGRWSLSGPGQAHGKELPSPGLIPHLLPSLSWRLRGHLSASSEMHVFLIGNILIVPLISFKLHEKYKGLDQEIVTKF